MGALSFTEVYRFYKLQDEFTDEDFIFEFDNCKIEFNFKNIFEE